MSVGYHTRITEHGNFNAIKLTTKMAARNVAVIKFDQVAYETELSGTPTAVFTEIQLIGQFLVLGIIILI